MRQGSGAEKVEEWVQKRNWNRLKEERSLQLFPGIYTWVSLDSDRFTGIRPNKNKWLASPPDQERFLFLFPHISFINDIMVPTISRTYTNFLLKHIKVKTDRRHLLLDLKTEHFRDLLGYKYAEIVPMNF